MLTAASAGPAEVPATSGSAAAAPTVAGSAYANPNSGADPNFGAYPNFGADLMGALISMTKQIGALRARLAPVGDRDISQTFLLVRLAEHGSIRAVELAEMVCADPSTVSRQVAALVKEGLIERRADPADGRACLLVATPAGLDHIATHRRLRAAMVAPLIADWSEQDRTDFLRLLRRFTRGLDAHRDAIIATLLEHRTDRSL